VPRRGAAEPSAPHRRSTRRVAWFYWIAPVLVLSALGIVVFLVLGYYLRVLRPKYRGR
jgi:hypothetical protein